MGVQTARLQVSAGSLPAGYCPTSYDQLLQDFANRLIVTPNLEFSTFVYGPVAPTSDMGPWFNTAANEWWVWDNSLGAYRSEKPSSITGEVQIGTVAFWDGPIASINAYWGDRWLFANGQLISRAGYPTYFALVGTKYSVGDGSTTFGIVDRRNTFDVGANADVAGVPNTIVSDGVTPTTKRAYTSHVHALGVASGVGAGHTAGNSYVGVELDPSSNAGGTVATRVLPPYNAFTPIVRVK